MKKTYIIPNEKVVDLGLEGQLLDPSVQGDYEEDYGGSNEEENMVKAERGSLWSNEW